MKKKFLVAIIAIAAVVGVGVTALHMDNVASDEYQAQPGRN